VGAQVILVLPEEAGRILTQLLHHGPGGGAVEAGGAEGLAAFQKGMQECLSRVLQIKVCRTLAPIV
jgi:hypothetical protein